MSTAADIAAFPIVLDVDVAWGEMDAFNHVNNAVYFRYFESARIAFLIAIGFAEPADNDGVGPILASTHCTFKRPLRFPDAVRIGARATELTDDRFVMEYIIHSTTLASTAATGGGVVVAYDYARNTKASIPLRVRDRIAELG